MTTPEEWARGTVARTRAHRQQIQAEGIEANEQLRRRGYPLPASPAELADAATCPHEHFVCRAEVYRLTATDDGPVTGYSADLVVWCGDCGQPFEWIGLPGGLSPS